MEGSGPPASQELHYARDALEDVTRTLGRLRVAAPDEELLAVMRAIAVAQVDLTLLAGRARATEEAPSPVRDSPRGENAH